MDMLKSCCRGGDNSPPNSNDIFLPDLGHNNLTNNQTNNFKCSYIPLPDLHSTIDAQNFNLFSLNIHSLNAHHEELVTTLAGLPGGFFDVLALQEIWSVNANFGIPGYHPMYYNSRDKNQKPNQNCGGGISLFIKNTLNFEPLPSLSHFEKGVYESLWAKIQINKDNYLIVGNVYRPDSPPLGNLSQALVIHSNILNMIKNDKSLKKGKLIICSDFNLDLASFSINKKANEYMELQSIHGLLPLITLSAHITNTSAKVIDHIFVKSPPPDSTSGVLQIHISDHLPVIYSDPTIKIANIDSKASKPLINNTTIKSCLNLLSKLTFNFNNDPKTDFDHFFCLLTEAGKLAFPLTKPKSRPSKNRNLPWVSKGLLVSIKQKHVLFKTKLKYPTALNKDISKLTINFSINVKENSNIYFTMKLLKGLRKISKRHGD